MSPRPRPETAETAAQRTRRLAARALWRGAGGTPAARPLFRWLCRRAVQSAAAQAPEFTVPYLLAERVCGAALGIIVEPGKLQRYVLAEAALAGRRLRPSECFVGSGEWSRLLQPFAVEGLNRTIAELIALPGAPRSTEAYAKLARRLGARGRLLLHGVTIDSEAMLDAYFVRLDRLIDSIRRDGVQARAWLARRAPFEADPNLRPRALEARETDVGIAIGAQGEIYRFRGGFHRTAIARQLGLARMPALVKLVHAEWLRRQIAATGAPPEAAIEAGVRALSS